MNIVKRYFLAGAVTLCSASVAMADLASISGDVIAPAYDELSKSAEALDLAAQQDCSAENLQENFQAIWDDWARIDYFHLGPVEEQGRSLAISFWPDPKSSGQRTQQGLVDSKSEVIDDPESFASISVAARGLSGMERLLYPGGVTGDEDRLCRLRRATAADLARMTGEVALKWPDFAQVLTSAGEAGNQTYLTGQEAMQAVYTQLVTGMEYLADTRIGRPLGTEDAPRPERAESLASGRSLRNITLSLEGMRDMALAIRPDAVDTRAGFDQAIDLARQIDDPILAGVAEPEKRVRIVELQNAVRAAKRAVETEIGEALGLSVGFNSRDGD
ncbi:imelysin family protein [Paracoccus aerodenitrificans]|uniref:imelysin family protein n=1 Tax=Paracoccus aerodenitrificans TaxID=3017781 RepID=UPI0022F0FCFF|nr:imelysin family protein [Paracoccus aerodenitrificans]WBU64996.1 imelysin family protein [Paracoccus aerodenitrificans]